jgi:NADH:ubiquinone oxidoreductase subunit 6 (subunit J)
MCVASRFEVRVYVGVCAVLLVVIIWLLMAVRGHLRGTRAARNPLTGTSALAAGCMVVNQLSSEPCSPSPCNQGV